MDILKEALALQPQIVKDRRELHQIPELGLELPRTKAYVVNRLREMGYEPQEIGGSSLIALAGGKKPGKVFLIRADMDALPIKELTGLPFASATENMHACGHDTHTAMLLGIAKILKDHEDEIPGTIKLFFQSGEETLTGAKESVDAGLLENPTVDAASMIHIISGIPKLTDAMGICTSGAVFASCDWYRIDVQGKGGHGSTPQHSISPVNILCAINTAIQEIIAMAVPAADEAVMTVGEIHAGDVSNVIPDTGYIAGTIRTKDERVRVMIKEKMEAAVNHIAQSRGGSAKITFFSSTPCNICDPSMRQLALELLPGVLGEDKVKDMEVELDGMYASVSGSEDFAFIAEKVPSFVGFLLAGCIEEGYDVFAHNPRSDFKEDDFYLGTAAQAALAMEWLKRNS